MAFSLSSASVRMNLPNTSSSCHTYRATLSLPRTNSLIFLLPAPKKRTLFCTLRITACHESKSPQIKPNNPSLNVSLQHQSKPSLTESNICPELHDDIGNENVGDTINLGGNNNGNWGGNGDGDGKGKGDDDDGKAENGDDEFGPLLSFEEVMQETEAHGVTLPADMLEAAKNGGIQKILLLRYIEMQVPSFLFFLLCFRKFCFIKVSRQKTIKYIYVQNLICSTVVQNNSYVYFYLRQHYNTSNY